MLATVLDARRLGHPVRVVAEGCRAVELNPGDAAAAFERMRSAGARLEGV